MDSVFVFATQEASFQSRWQGDHVLDHFLAGVQESLMLLLVVRILFRTKTNRHPLYMNGPGVVQEAFVLVLLSFPYHRRPRFHRSQNDHGVFLG